MQASLKDGIMSRYEQARYTVVESEGDIEIRDYASRIAVQTEVGGDSRQTANRAFGMLFSYISGANTSAQKIPMTVPVIEKKQGEKIRMTVPV